MVRIFGNLLIALTLMFFIGAVPLAAAEKGAAKEKKAVESKAKPEKKEEAKAAPAAVKEAAPAADAQAVAQTGLDIKIAELKKEIEVLKQKGEADRVRALERRLKEYEIDNEINKIKDDIRTLDREGKKAEAETAQKKITALQNEKTDFVLSWLAEELRWATKVVDTIKIKSILAELNSIGDRRYMEKRDAFMNEGQGLTDKDTAKKNELTNKLNLLFIEQQILGFERELAGNAVAKKEAQIAHDTAAIESVDSRTKYIELAMELAKLDQSIENEKDPKKAEELKDKALEVNLKRLDAQKPTLLYEVGKAKLTKRVDTVINFLDLYYDVDTWKEFAAAEREVERARVAKDAKKAEALDKKKNYLGKLASGDEKNPLAYKEFVEYARAEKMFSDMERYNDMYYSTKVKRIRETMLLDSDIAADPAKAAQIAEKADSEVLALLKEKVDWISKWGAEQEKEGITNIGIMFIKASAASSIKIAELEIQERKLLAKDPRDPKLLEIRKELVKLGTISITEPLISEVEALARKASEKGDAWMAVDMLDRLYRLKAEAEVQGLTLKTELLKLDEQMKREVTKDTAPSEVKRKPEDFQKEKEITAKFSKEKIAAINDLVAQLKTKGNQSAVDFLTRKVKILELAHKKDLLALDLQTAKAKDDSKASDEIENQLRAAESEMNKASKEFEKANLQSSIKELEAKGSKTADEARMLEDMKSRLKEFERN